MLMARQRRDSGSGVKGMSKGGQRRRGVAKRQAAVPPFSICPLLQSARPLISGGTRTHLRRLSFDRSRCLISRAASRNHRPR